MIYYKVKNKKIAALLIALCILFTVLPCTVFSEDIKIEVAESAEQKGEIAEPEGESTKPDAENTKPDSDKTTNQDSNNESDKLPDNSGSSQPSSSSESGSSQPSSSSESSTSQASESSQSSSSEVQSKEEYKYSEAEIGTGGERADQYLPNKPPVSESKINENESDKTVNTNEQEIPQQKETWRFVVIGVLIFAAIVASGLIIFHKEITTAISPEDKEISEIIPLGPMVYPEGEVWANTSSIIGTRNYQQDYVLTPRRKNIDAATIKEKGYFCILCDGMGGLEDGGAASKTCAEIMMEQFYSSCGDVKRRMLDAVDYADEVISCIKNSNGKSIKAGTTMACVHIKDGKLTHSSVGDSRIYIYRKGQITQLSRDHNYFEDLVAGHAKGSPEWKKALNDKKKDALTSYVGMGEIRHFDCSEKPIFLEKDDVIFMCSDGFYRSVSENEMSAIISKYIDHIEFLPHVMTATAFDVGKIHQDNTTVATIKYIG